MKKSRKIYLTIISIILCLFSILFILKKDYILAIFSALFLTFSIILLIKDLFEEKNLYKSEIKKILKTYDSILVEIKDLPKLSDKRIIITKYFDDMVNAEYELRKPIYYLNSDSSCDFVLLDKNDAYVYTIKNSKKIISPLELSLGSRTKDEVYAEKEYELMDSLDKTSIIKIDDEKKYKVSPVRKKLQ